MEHPPDGQDPPRITFSYKNEVKNKNPTDNFNESINTFSL